jgi:hypothetical protein
MLPVLVLHVAVSFTYKLERSVNLSIFLRVISYRTDLSNPTTRRDCNSLRNVEGYANGPVSLSELIIHLISSYEYAILVYVNKNDLPNFSI